MPRRKLIHPGLGLSGPRPARTILLFLSKIKVVGSCWLWQAALDENNYGRFWFRKRSRGAHRVSYFLFVDDIPEGMDIDHHHETCPHHCVNPEHLRPLTRSDNSSDGRSRRYKPVEAPDSYDGIPI